VLSRYAGARAAADAGVDTDLRRGKAGAGVSAQAMAGAQVKADAAVTGKYGKAGAHAGAHVGVGAQLDAHAAIDGKKVTMEFDFGVAVRTSAYL
jgi:hypothetical protein